ncbi:MAG: Uma2 family endonuclease [Lachnospiraceae bacterium]|nr:Uma2 family endonuclease [Lachnospiraceae bacterium]
MDIEKLKKRKQELGYSMAQLSESSGIPLGTLQKIFTGETKQPRYETMQALEKVLGPKASPRRYLDAFAGLDTMMVSETAVAYGKKRQGEYTVEDYYALPDDQRVELIDGVFYDMASPRAPHQFVAGEIYRQISTYIMERKGQCMPFIAPLDVQLDCDDKTMLQPDAGILCDRSKLRKGIVYGAPDFLVEVLSPSTRMKDQGVKLMKYMHAGVRECWLVDTERRMVMNYFFEDPPCPAMYPFDASIPVRIYDGDLKVSLSGILPWLEEGEKDER